MFRTTYYVNFWVIFSSSHQNQHIKNQICEKGLFSTWKDVQNKIIEEIELKYKKDNVKVKEIKLTNIRKA